MSALLLYIAVAVVLLAAWHRFVQRLTRAAALVLILLPMCFTGRALLSGKVYAPIDLPYMSEPLSAYRSSFGIGAPHNGTLSDLYTQIMPWRKAVRHAWLHGDWPLLNPFMLCGDILAGAAQPAPYDPFNLVGLLIPMAPSLTFAAVITFFLAGLCAFAFAREIGCRETAAMVAAAGWMFSGDVAFFVAWPLARSWVYLPLLLFAVRRLVREPRLRNACVLLIAFVLLIFAGHPESVLHVTAIGAAYGIFELAGNRKHALRAIALAAGAGAVAFLLTAIYLLPFFEAAPQTMEHGVRTGVFAHTPFPAMPDVTRRRVSNLFLPFYGGQPWHNATSTEWDPQTARAGSIVLALALCAAFLGRRRRETWFFLAAAVICAWAGADALPVSRLLHALPLFRLALNERLAFAAAFALSVLAAIAVDEWPASRARYGVAALFACFAGALFAATAAVWSAQLSLGVPAGLMRSVMTAEILPLLLIAGIALARVAPRVAVPIILLLLLVQRVIVDGSIYPTVPVSAFYPDIPLMRAIPKDVPEPFRVVGAHFVLIPDSAAFYEIEDPRGYEAMTNSRLVDTYPLWSVPQPVSFNAVGDLGRPFLSFLNIRYVLAPPDALPLPPWKFVYGDRSGKLYENPNALPRAFVPHRIRYEKSSTEIISAMYDCPDFGDLAWIQVPEYPPHTIANGPGALTIREIGNGLDIHAAMEGDGWVVTSQTAWRGWRAYIDGRRVQTRFADHAFVGVFVPKGNHHVRLVYLPESFTRGRAISFSTLLLLILGGAIPSVRRRLQPRAVRL